MILEIFTLSILTILITDADPIVPKNWISSFVQFLRSDVGLCGSATMLTDPKREETFFDRRQAYDEIVGFRNIGYSVIEDMI